MASLKPVKPQGSSSAPAKIQPKVAAGPKPGAKAVQKPQPPKVVPGPKPAAPQAK